MRQQPANLAVTVSPEAVAPTNPTATDAAEAADVVADFRDLAPLSPKERIAALLAYGSGTPSVQLHSRFLASAPTSELHAQLKQDANNQQEVLDRVRQLLALSGLSENQITELINSMPVP